MASRGLKTAFYTATFLIYCYTLWYDWNFLEVGHNGYGGKFKFLTFWNLILQTVYFVLCVGTVWSGADRTATKPSALDVTRPSAIQRARDTIHATLAFPVGTFVVCTFWALYAVDRELVYPKALDALIPAWMNHLLHTTVLPLLLMDKCLVYHRHPRRLHGIAILAAFALIYLLWILWIAFAADLWVYPVLRVMENQQRAVFIGSMLLFFICLYLIGEALTKFMWRKERAVMTSIPQKVK